MQDAQVEKPMWLVEPEVNLGYTQSEIVQGLQKPEKALPAKLFYDELGSKLFEEICELDEYYPTRTETAILRQHIDEIAALVGPECMLVEYGSGNSKKTRILLDHLEDPVAYVPIDISKEQLVRSAASLVSAYPMLRVIPVFADYTDVFSLPALEGIDSRRVAYFPGSTIGNLYPAQAVEFMSRVAGMVGPGGCFLIGVDLKKDPAILNLAYNDRKGITAAFNKNILVRLNRECQADFSVERFKHHAFYNEGEGRIEMHLISQRHQIVRVGGTEISFGKGEGTLTEVSYKYTLEEFAQLAEKAGFQVGGIWTDEKRFFSVQYLLPK